MPLERTIRHLRELYQRSPDPWGHTTRPYEREKYRRTLAALDGRTFREAVEIGCGIGALSELLAPRAASLLAIDCVPHAIEAARQRLAAQPHVRLLAGTAPDDLPALAPDLIVLSEVLYFMTRGEIIRLAGWCRTRAVPGARIVVVTWLGSTDEPLSGPASFQILHHALADWSHIHENGGAYRIDLLDRPAGIEELRQEGDEKDDAH